MIRQSFVSLRRDAFLLTMVIAYLGLCALGGGASRTDVLSLLYLRPAAVLLIWVSLRSPEPAMDSLRWPSRITMATAILMLVQLIPFPPIVWQKLPSYTPVLPYRDLLGVTTTWLPLSISPDLTLNSLLALLPFAAVLMAGRRLRREQRVKLIPVFLAIVMLSAVLGIVQAATGGMPQLYRITSENLPVGAFSNRNHQAVLLATGIFVARVWAAMPSPTFASRRGRIIIAIVATLLLIPLVIVTGSRAGTLIAFLTFVAAVLLPMSRTGVTRGRIWIIKGVLLMVPVVIAGVVFALGRGVSIDRLFHEDTLGGGERGALTPVVWAIARHDLPWGTGFGTFDVAFRASEPDSALHFAFFNHAHNDLLETLLTGGIPAMLLLAGFLAWFITRLARLGKGLFSRNSGLASDQVLVMAMGAVILANLLMASLVDYPLRTPLMGAVAALACLWLADEPGRFPRHSSRRT